MITEKGGKGVSQFLPPLPSPPPLLFSWHQMWTAPIIWNKTWNMCNVTYYTGGLGGNNLLNFRSLAVIVRGCRCPEAIDEKNELGKSMERNNCFHFDIFPKGAGVKIVWFSHTQAFFWTSFGRKGEGWAYWKCFKVVWGILLGICREILDTKYEGGGIRCNPILRVLQ